MARSYHSHHLLMVGIILLLATVAWGLVMPTTAAAAAAESDVVVATESLLAAPAGWLAHVFAEGEGGFGAVESKIDAITKGLQGLGRPVASLALIVAVLMILFAKALPGSVQEQRGTIMSILVMIVVIGVLPDVVNWLWGLGGGTTTTTDDTNKSGLLLIDALLRTTV